MPNLGQAIVDFVQHAWTQWASAPGMFLPVAVFALGYAYFWAWYYHQRGVRTRKETITRLKESVAAQEIRIVSLEEILARKNEKIATYRQRLGLPSPDDEPIDYARLSDAELGQVVHQLVTQIRALVQFYRQTARDSAQAATEAIREYTWEFLPAALRLRDVLRVRLPSVDDPTTAQDAHLVHRAYRQPERLEDLEAVATDLEHLATGLAGKTVIFENR